VVVPCLDEERTVGRVVRDASRTLSGTASAKILVIDDGSSDATAERAREAGAEVVVHSTTRGLGASFQEAVGIALSRGVDIMVHIDGDGQFDPADIPLLVQPLLDGRAQMATASRFAEPALAPNMPWIKKWGNRRVARIVRRLTGKRFHDVSCGFRAYSNKALLQMNLFGSFTYTQEVFLDLSFKGVPIVEVPVKVRGVREYGQSRIASSLWKYAWRTSQIMTRAFMSYRPFAFFAVLAAGFLAIGGALLLFLLIHRIRSGQFSPHIWSGFVGGSFGFLGIITLVIGFVGDMLVRIRLNQEHLLFLLKLGRWNVARSNTAE